jgi:hypothetical protein
MFTQLERTFGCFEKAHTWYSFISHEELKFGFEKLDLSTLPLALREREMHFVYIGLEMGFGSLGNNGNAVA